MEEQSGFVWMFPCYILANNSTRDPTTGEILLDDKIRFIAPGVPSQIAIFTDSHLAEEYRDQSEHRLSLELVELRTPEKLRAFLLLAQKQFRMVVVDPNRKARVSRSFLVEELIQELFR
jgi:hypothetical protein